jgi:type II secretory pathway pseudopilin PulG
MALIKTGEAGFSILEVIIAVLVLGLALVGAASMQTKAVQEADYARHLTGRVTATENVMEDLMNRTIVPSDPDLDPIFVDPDGQKQDATIIESPTHFVQYRIIPDSPLRNLVTIQVLTTPRGEASEEKRQKRQVAFSYIRSTRFH